MAKRKSSPSFKMVNKSQFLLPKIEFFVTDKETGEGFFLSQVPLSELLEYQKGIKSMLGGLEDTPLTDVQALTVMSKLVVLSACDDIGNRFFDDEDVALLAKKSPVMLRDAADIAMRLSGMDEVADTLKKANGSSSTD